MGQSGQLSGEFGTLKNKKNSRDAHEAWPVGTHQLDLCSPTICLALLFKLDGNGSYRLGVSGICEQIQI